MARYGQNLGSGGLEKALTRSDQHCEGGEDQQFGDDAIASWMACSLSPLEKKASFMNDKDIFLQQIVVLSFVFQIWSMDTHKVQ